LPRPAPAPAPFVYSMANSTYPVASFNTQSGLKSCGHRCSPSSLPRCCACMDKRPMRPENTYPIYVDGRGWQDIGSRDAGYCPNCRSPSGKALSKQPSASTSVSIYQAAKAPATPSLPTKSAETPYDYSQSLSRYPIASFDVQSALKSCGHTCFPSSLPGCCACMDQRPLRPENTYPVYVDGQGWQDIGSRDSGYCPTCRSNSSKSAKSPAQKEL
jgi:hypothetical protein